MKTRYVEGLHLSKQNEQRLAVINGIIEKYRKQGLTLTLRQLYYQLVTQNIVENKIAEYSKLSILLTKGRMAGVVDWDGIEDRIRVPDKPSSWNSPQEIIRACAEQYRRDRMRFQDVHIEVWVEKDALSGVLKRVTHPYGVHLMVNRGYSSTSAMHDAFLRFEEAWDADKKVVILYLGDHDPSGLDMVRDIKGRVDTFKGYKTDEDTFEITRVALTSAQIKQYNPPPNPAKLSDPRAKDYIAQFGAKSWEVDALPPEVLHSIVEDSIVELIDMDKFNEQKEQEKVEKQKLVKVAKQMEGETS
jgi:hypothetical protein